jgi:hypothetical protein
MARLETSSIYKNKNKMDTINSFINYKVVFRNTFFFFFFLKRNTVIGQWTLLAVLATGNLMVILNHQ